MLRLLQQKAGVVMLERLAPLARALKDNLDLAASLVGALAQVLVALVAYGKLMPQFFWEAPYAVVAVLWVSSCMLAFVPATRRSSILDPRGAPLRTKAVSFRVKVGAIAICTVSAGVALWLVHHEKSRRTIDIITPPPFNLPSSWLDRWVPVANAQPRTVATVSLVDSESSLSGRLENGRLLISPDERTLKRLIDGAANETPAEAMEAPRISQWLTDRARSKGMRQYLALTSDLVALSRDRPDAVNKLMPTAAEFAQLPVDQRAIVRHWAARYVGIWNPRLRITVDNTSTDTPINIIAVKFRITYADFSNRFQFDQRMNSAVLDTLYVPLVPDLKTVEIRWDSVSEQTSLIPAKAIGKFDVVLLPDPAASRGAKKITCVGRLSLLTSVGELTAGEVSLETFNPWLGGALAMPR